MIRCSSLPLAFVCGGSVAKAEIKIDGHNAAATTGTAVHYALDIFCNRDGMRGQEAIDEALARYPEVDRQEVSMLFWLGAKMWTRISEWMPDSRGEVAFSHNGLTGHIDRLSIVGKKAVILDWKSGRKDYDYHHQGFGYAYGVFVEHPEVEEATVHFAWLRTKELESYTVSRERAMAWKAQLDSDVIGWRGAYVEGKHCVFCHRNHECPAFTAMVRRDVAMFGDGVQRDLAAMDDPTFATYFRRVKGLGVLLQEAEEHMRAEVVRRGEVDDGKGGVIHFVAEAGNREIDALKAWPVLTKALPDAELAACLKVRVGALEDAVAAKAIKELGKGKGAAAKRQLASDLEEAGAVTREPVTRLRDERRR